MLNHRYNKFYSVKEDEIENYLVRRIQDLGGRAIKFDPRNGRGLPDRICFLPGGLLLLVEVKRPDVTSVRKNQELQLASFRRLGFQATWCNTKDKIEKIVHWIKDFKKKYIQVERECVCMRRDCPLREEKN